MKFKIGSDIIPFATGDHKKENWKHPESNKHMVAHDILKNKNREGFYSASFNSKTQEFSPIITECYGLSDSEISDITAELNRCDIP